MAYGGGYLFGCLLDNILFESVCIATSIVSGRNGTALLTVNFRRIEKCSRECYLRKPYQGIVTVALETARSARLDQDTNVPLSRVLRKLKYKAVSRSQAMKQVRPISYPR